MKLIRSLITATALLAACGALQAQTFSTTTALPATVPDPLDGCVTQAAPLNLTIPVSGITGPVSSLSVQIGLRAEGVGAVSMPLLGRVGANGTLSPGDFSELSGTYRFVDPSAPGATSLWAAAAAAANADVIAPGTYYTSEVGGTATSAGAPTPLNATFAGLTPAQINGDWTLRVTDFCQLDATSVQAPAALTLTAAAAPTAVPTLGEGSLVLLALGCGAVALRRLARARQPTA